MHAWEGVVCMMGRLRSDVQGGEVLKQTGAENG